MTRNLTRYCLLMVALALPRIATAQSAGDIEQAKEHFDSGVELFNENDWEAALVEFQAAHALTPHWKALLNIGMCYWELHDYVSSNLAFSEAIEIAEGIDPQQKENLVNWAEKVGKRVGSIDFSGIQPGLTVLVNGKNIGSTPMPEPVYVSTGMHTVQVKGPGFETWSEEIAVTGGLAMVLEPELIAIQTPDDPPNDGGDEDPMEKPDPLPVQTGRKNIGPAAFWGTLGSALALGVTGAVLLVVANGKHEAFLDKTRDDPAVKELRSDGLALQWSGDALVFAAGALAVTAVVLAIFTKFKKDEKPGDTATSLLASPGGLVLTW